MTNDQPDSPCSLDPHIDNGEWAAEIARREATGIEPVSWSDLQINPMASAVKPRPMLGLVVHAGKFVAATTAIRMIRKSHPLMSEDGAAVLFVRIISDPDSLVVTKGTDGRPIPHVRLACFQPDRRRSVFVGDDGRDVQMDQISISYAELVIWLRDNVMQKDFCSGNSSMGRVPPSIARVVAVKDVVEPRPRMNVRGRPGDMREKAVTEMVRKLQAGETTMHRLMELKQKKLPGLFPGVAGQATMLHEARIEACRRFSENSRE